MFANKFGDHDNVCCGLVKVIKQQDEWEPPVKIPIPLISVDVKASVVHAVAQVEVTQTYVNKEEQPIEAIYYFPMNPDGAVTHFQAELEGRVIKGTVKPQDEAKQDYEEAVDNETTAFLGEETKADIFMVRVGFLKPGSQAKVIIGYVTEVKNEPGTNAIRFYIPTTVAPRYVSRSETDDKANDIKNMAFSLSSPAPLSMKVAVSLQGGIKSIESPTHKVTVERTSPISPSEIWHKAIVQLSGETVDMDRDFVLHILPEESHKPRLYSEKTENGSTAIMIHLIPSFKLDEQKTELIFVLDRSGSMGGRSIELAKKALLLFLHSMPADCYFNVIGFGSTYEFLFPESVKYADGSLKKAVAHAKSLDANLGGTEILEPMKAIYGKPGIPGYIRQLFILTDGQVSNTDGVLGIAQANASKARVFALGIGDGASHHLVEGVAKAGGGTSAFVTNKESIDKKVLNQLKNGLQPSLTDIELEWEGLSADPVAKKASPVLSKEKSLLGYNKPIKEAASQEVDLFRNKQSPKRIPPVYDGSQMLVFGLFKDECPKFVTIKAQSPDGPLTIKIENSSTNEITETGMLHRLAAIKLVRELELEESALCFQDVGDVTKETEKLKKEIVEISCQNGITSKHTSFVAIDVKEYKPSAENWVMETRNVPTQIPRGWHGHSGPGLVTLCSMSSSAASFSSFKACSLKKKKSKRSTRSFTLGSSSSSLFSKMKKCVTKSFGGQGGHPENSVQARCLDFSSYSRALSANSNLLGCGAAAPMNLCLEEDSSTSPLFPLISIQSFDGSYALDEKIAAVIGKSLQKMKEVASQLNLQEQVFATALAISYFVTKMSAEKDLWELIVIKARKWLAKSMKPEEVDGVIKAATTFLEA